METVLRVYKTEEYFKKLNGSKAGSIEAWQMMQF
jgi:hypothetical protein